MSTVACQFSTLLLKWAGAKKLTTVWWRETLGPVWLAAGLKATTMFLDIKGGFDNVDHMTLKDRLESRNAPSYMVKWIANFISYRQCAMVFLGSPRKMVKVHTGMPQGSPLSPILFVIYVEPLHECPNPTNMFISSFVDDIQVTLSSSSWIRNTVLLEGAYTRIRDIANSLKLRFSTDKTDLMHWRIPRDRSVICEHPIKVDEECIQPTPKSVKWLGFHFELNLSTRTHFTKRLSLAQTAFDTIKRLSTPGGKLSA